VLYTRVYHIVVCTMVQLNLCKTRPESRSRVMERVDEPAGALLLFAPEHHLLLLYPLKSTTYFQAATTFVSYRSSLVIQTVVCSEVIDVRPILSTQSSHRQTLLLIGSYAAPPPFGTVFHHLYALLTVSLVLGLRSRLRPTCSQDISSRSTVCASDTLIPVFARYKFVTYLLTYFQALRDL